jgi:hypothetical protein
VRDQALHHLAAACRARCRRRKRGCLVQNRVDLVDELAFLALDHALVGRQGTQGRCRCVAHVRVGRCSRSERARARCHEKGLNELAHTLLLACWRWRTQRGTHFPLTMSHLRLTALGVSAQRLLVL